MAHVDEHHTLLSATRTFIHKWNKPYLPLLADHTASLPYALATLGSQLKYSDATRQLTRCLCTGRYSFPVQLRVGAEFLVTHPSMDQADLE